MHWSKLPALHDTIAHRIPDDCYLTPGFPWRLGQTTTDPPDRDHDPLGPGPSLEGPSGSGVFQAR